MPLDLGDPGDGAPLLYLAPSQWRGLDSGWCPAAIQRGQDGDRDRAMMVELDSVRCWGSSISEEELASE